MKNLMIFGLCWLGWLAGCAEDRNQEDVGAADAGFEGPRFRAEFPDDADYLFDDSALRTYEIELSVDDLAFIDADPAEEIYVPATLRFEGMELANVGLRYKGSVGAFFNCVAGGSFSEPDGEKICQKLSMKVKVNWEADDQLFYGLKKLQFHSMKNDQSLMRERLAYQVFREMGVPAPRAVHARLVINGVYQGVFMLVEQIDGRFTRSRFADGEGNLYKELWPMGFKGDVHAEELYMAALRTNENDQDVSVDRMMRFAEDVAEADKGKVAPVIEEWMDLDVTMRYLATDRAILNDDGIFHWYCSSRSQNGECAPHNFFWYEETARDRLYLVPWDTDISLSLANPITTLNTSWDETTNDCEVYVTETPYELSTRDAACDSVIDAWTEYGSEFAEHTEALLDGPFSGAKVESDLLRWHDQIFDAVAEAEAMHPGSVTVLSFHDSLERLKTDLTEMRRRLQMRLGRNVEPTSSSDLLPAQ